MPSLRPVSILWPASDVPMGGCESDQVQRHPTTKEVQEATKVMGELIEDQGHHPSILDSKCSKLVPLITLDKGGLGPI